MPYRSLREPQAVRRTGRALLLYLALAAASCQSSPSAQPPLSANAVRLDLPLVRQDALYDCGLASLSALCAYWSVELSDAKRDELAATAEISAGLSGDELRETLRALGLDAYLFSGSLDREATGLLAHIDAGRPPLVMLSRDGAGHHYALVLGYDEPRGVLILLDPSKGEIVTPNAVFEREWARCERFTLLACRPPTDRAPGVPYDPPREADTLSANH